MNFSSVGCWSEAVKASVSLLFPFRTLSFDLFQQGNSAQLETNFLTQSSALYVQK